MTKHFGYLAVGIATRGRPSILLETLRELRRQFRQPDSIFVAYTETADIGEAPHLFPDVRFIRSRLGLTSQRNAILDELHDYDFLTFIDDDFWLASDYLTTIMDVVMRHPEIGALTGRVLADGINGRGLGLTHARSILSALLPFKGPATFSPIFTAYGCNMTLRLDLVRKCGLRFDEQLPLYGWQEDVDFCRQLILFGAVVHVHQAVGVHLGVKSGRQSGLRLGYSQVANPIYLAQKGSVSWIYAIASISSRTLKNLVFSLRPEPYIDRRGRLVGNTHGWLDLIRGSLHPTRILAL